MKKLLLSLVCLLAVSLHLKGKSAEYVRLTSEIDSPYFFVCLDSSGRLKIDSISRNFVYTIWDEDNIDPYKYNIAKKTDTTQLILVKSNSIYVHPVKNKINSVFGLRGYRYHYGIDIELDTGDSVLCAFNGKVRLAKYYSGYGNFVLVTHTNGLETLYAHLSKINVEVGQIVHSGDLLGLGGQTGRASGSHLHFEVRFMGKPMDPTTIIDFDKYTLKSDTLNLSCHTYEYLIERSKTKYYYIRSGDTLYKISRMYGVSIDRLCALNGITRNTILKIGRPLRYQ